MDILKQVLRDVLWAFGSLEYPNPKTIDAREALKPYAGLERSLQKEGFAIQNTVKLDEERFSLTFKLLRDHRSAAVDVSLVGSYGLVHAKSPEHEDIYRILESEGVTVLSKEFVQRPIRFWRQDVTVMEALFSSEELLYLAEEESVEDRDRSTQAWLDPTREEPPPAL